MEAGCLLDVIRWISSLGFHSVEFESDAKGVVNAV